MLISSRGVYMYDRDGIANRLFEARKNKNLKQIDVANALGINQSSYSALESGKRDMSVAELYILSDTLSESVTWLLGEKIITDLTDEECLMLENILRYINRVRKK